MPVDREAAITVAEPPGSARVSGTAIATGNGELGDAHGAAREGTLIALTRWLEAHALFLAGVAAVVVFGLTQAPTHLAQDGWLALVAGRIIAVHGIPSHDYLTVMAHGARWVDQQWLAQLTIYELARIGGLALYTVVYVALSGLAFAFAIAAARRLGGEDRHVTWVLPTGGLLFVASSLTIRTQGFGYPLFVATVWLLASAARGRAGRRVYLVFPLLALWANLHGSVTLGVALAMLYGATVLVRRLRAARWAGLADPRGLSFLFGSPLCLLATPYGLSIVHYYHSTLLNSEFGKLVTEWQPVTSTMVLAVPCIALLIVTVWLLGASGKRTPAFDQLALVLLGCAAIFAVRNVTWFGLGTLILLPAAITTVARDRQAAARRVKLNLAIALTAVALVLVATLATFARPASWLQSTYPQRAIATIERITARNPATKIFADVRYADWLLWRDPRLAGHIAYDASFELLSSAQLESIASLGNAPLPGVRDTIGPYTLLVLDPANSSVNRLILARSHAIVVLRSKKVLIATKSTT